jgi:uncharacterized membrane protein
VLDRIIALGPMFLAVPMAVFGADHLVFSESVTPMVPSWIPWHLFWVLVVGICLIAGALSLVLRKYAPLAAVLFGTMLLLFELLLHIPKIVHTPTDRFAWAVALRDLAFAAGALSFAAVHVPTQWARFARRLPALARFVIGVAAVFFAVEHFLHPEFKPGIPLKQLTPLWIPARVPLAYLTGQFLLAKGVALICNKGVRLAASSLGLLLLPLTLLRCASLKVKPHVASHRTYEAEPHIRVDNSDPYRGVGVFRDRSGRTHLLSERRAGCDYSYHAYRRSYLHGRDCKRHWSLSFPCRYGWRQSDRRTPRKTALAKNLRNGDGAWRRCGDGGEPLWTRTLWQSCQSPTLDTLRFVQCFLRSR